MIATTTTTPTVALALRRISESPYDRTRAATWGPDVVVGSTSLAGGSGLAAREFAPVVHARGVVGTSGPYPLAFVRLSARGVDAPVQVEGRDLAPASIDRPLVISGRWIDAGRAVVEQGLAEALGLHPNAQIQLGGRRFTVFGIAVTAAQPIYPARTPGVVWVTRADAARLHSVRGPLGALINLRLASPGAARQVLDAVQASALSSDPGSFADAWQDVRSHDYRIVTVDQEVLAVATTLLALLAISSIAVLVGGRMTEQIRRVGLLKRSARPRHCSPSRCSPRTCSPRSRPAPWACSRAGCSRRARRRSFPRCAAPAPAQSVRSAIPRTPRAGGPRLIALGLATGAAALRTATSRPATAADNPDRGEPHDRRRIRRRRAHPPPQAGSARPASRVVQHQ